MLNKKVTIVDIAKEAGVSASMVSRVASGKGVVSEKNRVRITELLEKYNYSPNAFARGLQKSKTGLIGFVIPHIGNEYFSSVYYEFEKLASEHGYMTIVYNGKTDMDVESRVMSVLEQIRVEAAVIMGGRMDAIELEESEIEEVRKFGNAIPTILCTEQAERFGCIGVHSDDKKACELIGNYLKEKGYRTVGILGGASSRVPTVNKIDYLKEEFRKAGLEIRPEWDIRNSYNEYDGAEAMRELLKQKELPEMIIGINDHVAFGAQMEAQAAGLRVPEDISFLGFDGVTVSRIAHPAISTIQIDYRKYGETIFEAIRAKTEGKEFPALSLIDPHLEIRGSSR